MLAMILSNVPWPPRSGRDPVVRVAIAVERDLDAVQPERIEPLDHLARQQQAVGDDVDRHRHAALGAATRAAARRGR